MIIGGIKLLIMSNLQNRVDNKYIKQLINLGYPTSRLEKDETTTTYIPPFIFDVIIWLESLGIYVETLIDGVDRGEPVEANFVCYRVFIYQLDRPAPNVTDDLGAWKTKEQAYLGAIDYILNRENNIL